MQSEESAASMQPAPDPGLVLVLGEYAGDQLQFVPL